MVKKIKISHIKEIIKLSKKSTLELRKLNEYPAYNGKELTREELIYQIVFQADAPLINKTEYDINYIKSLRKKAKWLKKINPDKWLRKLRDK